MTSPSALRTSSVALIILAFVVTACGGGTPSAAPSTAAVTQAAPSTAPTTPPVTEPPATQPPASTGAEATLDPSVDPAADLKIAAPYTLDPLDEQIAQIFVTAMKSSAGQMGDLFQFGFRTATKDGQAEAWVIVMAFPDIPMTSKQLLDQISGAATSGGGTVEDTTIGGDPAKLIEQGGQSIVMLLNGNELLMIVGTSKKATLNSAEAIAKAN
jgi:hypothetical protein